MKITTKFASEPCHVCHTKEFWRPLIPAVLCVNSIISWVTGYSLLLAGNFSINLKFHLSNYIICNGNVLYFSVVPRWRRKFKILWMMMSGRGIYRRFRKPEHTKEHIKNYSNRYFDAKLVNLSQILCSKPFGAWSSW